LVLVLLVYLLAVVLGFVMAVEGCLFVFLIASGYLFGEFEECLPVELLRVN
jgi:hypothetical protein